MSDRARFLKRLSPAILLLLVGAGCSNTNLGDIDESVDSREEMPGPGIFANDAGESALKWSSDSNQSTTVAAQTDVTTAEQKAEFEQFKAWNELRTKGDDSKEYREFQQWLEYQKFKTSN